MDVRRDAVVVERHVKNGFGGRQRVEKRGNVRVERFRGRERALLRVTEKWKRGNRDEKDVAGLAEIGERGDEIGSAVVEQRALRREEGLVNAVAGDENAVIAREEALRENKSERGVADDGDLEGRRREWRNVEGVRSQASLDFRWRF